MSTAAREVEAPAAGLPAPGGARRWVLAIGLIALALQAGGFHDLRHDDAYITFRYSANLATGQGLVFNPGERLMGSTSPGHALLGALIYLFVPHAAFPTAMAALGCVAWTLQGLAVFVLLDGPLRRGGATFVALAVLAGAAWSHRFLALETNLVAAAVLAAIAAGVRSRWMLSAALCALAGLLRSDALLLVLPLGVMAARELRGAVWRPVVLGAVLSAPWYLFAYGYFGTVLPQSAAAKVASEGYVEYAGKALPYVTANVARPYLEYGQTGMGTWVSAVLVLVVAGVGAGLLARRQPRLMALPAFATLVLAAYVRMRPQPGLEWHLYPVLLTVTVLALVALAVAAERLRPGRAPLTIGAALVLAFAARTASYAHIHERGYWYGARDDVYRAVAEHIRARSEPDDWIASIEVGTLGYYTGLPVLDMAGLVTRDPRRVVPTAPYRWLVDVPAYPAYYDAVRAGPPFVTFASEPIDAKELHYADEERFVAVVEDRSSRDR